MAWSAEWRALSGIGEEREIPLGADGVECGVRVERRELPLRAVALSAEWRARSESGEERDTSRADGVECGVEGAE